MRANRLNRKSLDHYFPWFYLTYGVTVTGLPAISVPCGFTRSGLPIGLQIVGRRRQEAAVLRAPRPAPRQPGRDDSGDSGASERCCRDPEAERLCPPDPGVCSLKLKVAGRCAEKLESGR